MTPLAQIGSSRGFALWAMWGECVIWERLTVWGGGATQSHLGCAVVGRHSCSPGISFSRQRRLLCFTQWSKKWDILVSEPQQSETKTSWRPISSLHKSITHALRCRGWQLNIWTIFHSFSNSNIWRAQQLWEYLLIVQQGIKAPPPQIAGCSFHPW